jgi:hypothetical protein
MRSNFRLILTVLVSLTCAAARAAAPVAVATVSPVSDPSIKTTGILLIAANNQDAQAILDGSSSSDADGNPLSYSWSIIGGSPFSTNATLTHTFDVGLWGVALVVSDGTTTSTATLAVQVQTPCEALDKMKIDITAEPGMPARDEQRLHAMLDAACRSFNKGHLRQGKQRLELFQSAVQRRLGNSFPFFSEDLIESAQYILDRIDG